MPYPQSVIRSHSHTFAPALPPREIRSRGIRSSLLLLVFVLLVVVPRGTIPTLSACGDDAPSAAVPSPTSAPPHEHHVIEVWGEPVLAPIQAPLQQPCRVVFDDRGHLLIADAGVHKVFRINPDGKVTTLAENLAEPVGLCVDSRGNCYIASHAGGEAGKGRIVRVDSAGEQTVVASDLTGPQAIVAGPEGNLYVALLEEDRVITVNDKGRVRQFVGNINAPAALCFDSKGRLLVVSSTDGTVTRVAPRGKRTIICRGLKMPTDIAVGPAGEIVVTNFKGTELTRIDAGGQQTTFLPVPSETIACCFDKAGNLVLLNSGKGWAVKATIRMTIPCPHCRKPIPLRIRPRPKLSPVPKKIF